MDSLKITKRNVTIFTVFVLIYGWVGVFIDKITNQAHYENMGTLSNDGTLGMGIFISSPLILVFILRTFCGDGWKDTGYKPNFRKNRKWYLLSCLIYPTVTVFMLILGYLTKTMVFNPISISVYLAMLIGQLFIQIIKNFFEESLWRGYLTSKLMKFSWSDWKLYVVSALICNFWHVPYYLVFLSKEEIISERSKKSYRARDSARKFPLKPAFSKTRSILSPYPFDFIHEPKLFFIFFLIFLISSDFNMLYIIFFFPCFSKFTPFFF